MSDKQQVRDAGIRSAIIVDDGYDEIPTVAELLDEDAWNSFFDDAQGDEAKRVEELFPSYTPIDREELKSKQEFINAIWHDRGKIKDLLGDLFKQYEQKMTENRPSLQAVESALEALDIPYKKCGRDFVNAAANVDLIVIDLFLGSPQSEPDRKITVQGLKKVLKHRQCPSLPSIILMSMVSGIENKAKDFRQEVKLHASAFRHIKKSDLKFPDRIKRLIITLALHRSDSHTLATFVKTWERKAIKAVKTSAGNLRKIDIDDLQHIQNMLLRSEGINTSSYILDVFDRVLQYQIESNEEVLQSASKLDKIEGEPAPLTISNDRDTYSIIDQTLFVNPQRLAHSTGALWPIAFGDTLGPRDRTQVKSCGFFSGNENRVFFVASPECDLIREDGLKTSLLVAGSLERTNITKLKSRLSEKTTPVIFLDGRRDHFQVEWDFGHLRTTNLKQMKQLLDPAHGELSIIARLRQVPALSLQQKFLSKIGRVAELSPLPRTQRFQANLFIPLQEGGTQPIKMSDQTSITGNIFFPTREEFATVIFDHKHEDELTSNLLKLDLKVIAKQSRQKFKALKEQTRIRQMFRSGFQRIRLPLNERREAILSDRGQNKKNSDTKNSKVDKIATLMVDGNISDIRCRELSKSGLIVQIHLEGGG